MNNVPMVGSNYTLPNGLRVVILEVNEPNVDNQRLVIFEDIADRIPGMFWVADDDATSC